MQSLRMNVATLALGSRQRQRLTKVRAKGDPRVIFHALGSVGKFEGMNPHTPK
jgi:hypothetical protein